MQAPTGLVHEHLVLMAQYGRAQARCHDLMSAHAAEVERLQSQAIRLRAAVIVRDSALFFARQDRGELEVAIPADLREKAVLCVGQDKSGATVAQRVVEMAGGQFLHHDGNARHAEALEASLVTADLVICQTGCVSHNAYWRVHDHCKRTGKQCVLVERPKAMQVVRGARPMSLVATESLPRGPIGVTETHTEPSP